MKKSYTDDDVKRWLDVSDRALLSLKISIADGELDGGYEVVDYGSYQEQAALSNIALGQYRLALRRLGKAAESWALLLEKKDQEDIDESLWEESVNGLFLAAGSGSESSVRRITAAYQSAFPDSARWVDAIRYGMSVRALCLRNTELASEWLDKNDRDESTEPHTRLLESIISEDEAAFAEVIRDSARYWRERVRSERLQRHPDAVCDLYGFTKIRLAERVWGRRPDVDLEAGQIPPELFEAHPETQDTIM